MAENWAEIVKNLTSGFLNGPYFPPSTLSPSDRATKQPWLKAIIISESWLSAVINFVGKTHFPIAMCIFKIIKVKKSFMNAKKTNLFLKFEVWSITRLVLYCWKWLMVCFWGWRFRNYIKSRVSIVYLFRIKYITIFLISQLVINH